jgi:sodium-dependent dicarboxylate transporter 2/3/5
MTESPGIPRWKWLTLALAPVAAAALYAILPAEQKDAAGAVVSGLSGSGRAVVSVGALMAVWWITEALPLEATALLPIFLFPMLGVMDVKATCAPYADPTIFFFMGGMMLGVAMERWGLPRRLALLTLARLGRRTGGASPRILVLGAMVATALISMWVNNTSTTVMMLPIGLSIVRLFDLSAGERKNDHFAIAMILGIVYAATIGGVGTLFGTAPNIILQSNVKMLVGTDLSFLDYAKVGVPIMVLFLPLAWVVLMVMFPLDPRSDPAIGEHVRREYRTLGAMNGGERSLLAVLGVAITLWIAIGPINTWIESAFGIKRALSEAGVSVLAAAALFAIPVRVQREGERVRVPALDWATASSIHWGVLVLFGGGLTLAEAMSRTGVNTAIGSVFEHLRDVPVFVVVLCVTALITMATEVASNTAIATTFLPIAYAGAKGLGVHPYVLMFPVALACSYAYMMPMGTPPNAMGIATGRVTIRHMVRAGLALNVIAIILISTYCAVVVPLIS